MENRRQEIFHRFLSFFFIFKFETASCEVFMQISLAIQTSNNKNKKCKHELRSEKLPQLLWKWTPETLFFAQPFIIKYGSIYTFSSEKMWHKNPLIMTTWRKKGCNWFFFKVLINSTKMIFNLKSFPRVEMAKSGEKVLIKFRIEIQVWNYKQVLFKWWWSSLSGRHLQFRFFTIEK